MMRVATRFSRDMEAKYIYRRKSRTGRQPDSGESEWLRIPPVSGVKIYLF